MFENNRVLTLFVPGLLGPVSQSSDPDFLWPKVDGLHWALGKASRRLAIVGTAADIQLCSLFGLTATGNTHPPLAWLSYLGETGAKPRYDCVCADPVHLHLDQNNALVQSGDFLQLSASEAQALCLSFNTMFSEDGIRLEFFQPDRWYLTGTLPDLPLVPGLAEVTGRHFGFSIPEGNAGRGWRQLVNDAQMVFHEHEVNTAREQVGQAIINSLWISGGGSAPPAIHPQWDCVYSDAALCKGLCLHAQARHQPVPEQFQKWDQAKGRALIHIQDPQRAILNGQLYEWRQIVEDVCLQWINPALDALKTGKLDALELYAADGPGYRVVNKTFWHFWKRPITIQSLQS